MSSKVKISIMSNGFNGKGIYKYFLSIDKNCNQMRFNIDSINDTSHGYKYWLIGDEGWLSCRKYLPEEYILITL